MKSLIATAGTFGPFSVIERLADGWKCDQVIYHDSVVGSATEGGWVAPQIIKTHAAQQADVDALAKTKRDNIVANISAAEMASWPIKRAEALLFSSSGLAADAPVLSIEAQARGITLASLVAKVLTKAAFFADLEAKIAGACGKHQDVIAALPLADVAAYDITAGWPV